jgi:hypothetical protein
MAQHPANAGVLEEGCRALKLLAFSSAATRERVARAGALPIVRRALESFPQDRWAAPPPSPEPKTPLCAQNALFPCEMTGSLTSMPRGAGAGCRARLNLGWLRVVSCALNPRLKLSAAKTGVRCCAATFSSTGRGL